MLTLDREELEEFSVGDERIMEYKKRVEKLNSDPEFMVFMSREEDQRKTENTLRNIVNEQSQELSNIKVDTARKMKNENIDVETISKVTGLSIEEIQNL